MSKEAGPNPTDRGKSDVKRSVLCDAAGIPLAVVIDGANRHDVKLFEPTFCAIVVERPRPIRGQAQGVCLDKGYDSRSVRELLKDLVLRLTSAAAVKKRATSKKNPDTKARRWVVERDHGWLNRDRAILVRWCKKPENYLACLHMACGFIAY